MTRLPPGSTLTDTLFPSTTLFRSGGWSRPVVAGSGSEDYAHWWSTLGDPMLEALVDEALAENLDLYQAVARVDEARAVRDRVAGGRAPVVEAGASVNRRRQSANGSLPIAAIPGMDRSEEHTSELQSLMRISYAVFRLNKQTNITTIQTTHSQAPLLY